MLHYQANLYNQNLENASNLNAILHLLVTLPKSFHWTLLSWKEMKHFKWRNEPQNNQLQIMAMGHIFLVRSSVLDFQLTEIRCRKISKRSISGKQLKTYRCAMCQENFALSYSQETVSACQKSSYLSLVSLLLYAAPRITWSMVHTIKCTSTTEK